MPNNRKRTRGRKIQVLEVLLTFTKLNAFGQWVTEPNKHEKAGKTIQIRHWA